MKIVTSYHHKTDKLLSDGFVVFNISRFSPRWVAKGKQIQFKILAPSTEMLTDGYEWDEFDSNLEKLNATEIIDQLKKLSNDNPIALCCYEKDSGKCHRSRVARWFIKNGFHVTEFQEQKI
ncbi:PF04343 domain protein [Leptospira borgpetersenii serovar Pomona str. 200901868]|uniref:PF04343 domain protein n=1 Tax=Leptospira borgpetersenii serovar Pomona str. 200901868 TaxID=1192866 RepID=M6W9N7_LEPBO|nr:PF04343 domain protein [Leptospira borgpetersenii serovar Pomona str. 200901868]